METFVCLCLPIVATDPSWNRRPSDDPDRALLGAKSDPPPKAEPVDRATDRRGPRPPGRTCDLRLSDLGNRLDCYFTIEGSVRRLLTEYLPLSDYWRVQRGRLAAAEKILLELVKE